MNNKSVKKTLWQFHETVTALRVSGKRSQAYKMLDEIIPHLDEYTAPPDLWHNISMEAARINRDAELAITQVALQEWPDSVDLLCDELQLRYSTHMDMERATEIWRTLDGMDKRITGSYWRFWAYGAIYYAVILKKRSEGLKLLDDGLCWVKRNEVMDILRVYRRILIDSSPEEPIEDVIAFQQTAMKQLEEKYQLGIQMGVVNSYVLAKDLALLYQEQAGTSNPNSERDYLQKALDALDLAEKLYTADVNHPIHEIYEARVRILMAQKKYSDALKILESLPISEQEDSSIQTMKTMAEQMLGRARQQPAATPVPQSSTEAPKEDRGEILNKALNWLLANNGEFLLSIARDNPEVAMAVKHIASEL
jgi:tetratricopeptide (TPR) repeat protein